VKYVIRNLCVPSLILGLLSATVTGQGLPTITKTGFTTKVIQLNGPCDWPSWDPKTPPQNGDYAAAGECGLTAAQAIPGDPYIATGVMGQDLGSSFEVTDTVGRRTAKLIFLFGDTIGFDTAKCRDDKALCPQPDPAKTAFPKFDAKDTLAWSTSAAEGDFTINYFALPLPGNPDSPLFVTEPGKGYLPPQPSGEEPSYVSKGHTVNMGAYDVPNSGISLNGQTYLIINTGRQIADSTSAVYSVLVKFDGISAFTTGRTVSETNYDYGIPCVEAPHRGCLPVLPDPGHFVFDALAHIDVPGPCIPILADACIQLPLDAVGIYGTGQYRASSLYFSYVPTNSFETGTDAGGNPTTNYFAGYEKDGTTPKWTNQESAAQPLFWDNPPTFAPPAYGESDPGTVGNVSLFYDSNAQLWMMLYDGGRIGGHATTGIYFTYAADPWGPWEKPQLIYNACQAHKDNGQGYGDILFYYTKDASDQAENECPSALSGINPGANGNAAWSGPAGPVIGTPDPFGHEAFTRRGGEYAPQIISRFSGSKGGALKLQFGLSTWNPYTVVLMETDFTITNTAEVGARHGTR
jgi:hypothetical protein